MTNSSFRLRAVALAACCGVLLVGCGGGSDDSSDDLDKYKADQKAEMEAAEALRVAMEQRAEQQRGQIESAIAHAETAVGAVHDEASDAEVTAAETAIMAIETAIMAADDVPDDELSAFSGHHDTLKANLDNAKESRQGAMQMAMDKADEDMMATAKKLHNGIGREMGKGVSPADGNALSNATDRAAAYNDSNVPTGNTPQTPIDTRIMVAIGTATPVALTEDKKTMVDANHGWEGKRYTASPDGDGMYEAMVYSHVEAPTEGKKFGGPAANAEFEYALTTGVTDATEATQNGEVTIDTTAAATPPSGVRLTGVTRTAGTEVFKFSESEITDRRIDIPGSYRGVSGIYYCTPTTRADGCSASVAASQGFTLTGGMWAFKPSDPNARVMSAEDTIYASYGWWIHKSADDMTYTASAFVDDKGTVPAATGLDTLNGTATYVGGAAGKYALSSSTGGTNDAGHFTAKAMLNANFTDNSITGTIDSFMGADGMSRDWSVELKKADVAATGGITRTDANDTVWTIGGTAAEASGEWLGTLKDNGDDKVPKVATGTFHSTYGSDGTMVGAFGVNVKE